MRVGTGSLSEELLVGVGTFMDIPCSIVHVSGRRCVGDIGVALLAAAKVAVGNACDYKG
jgi:hypothetical protein